MSRQNKCENKKTKMSSFCIQNNLFRWCCFLVVVFPFLWWTTRHCRIGYTTCLPCLWMWNYSDMHGSLNICIGSFHLLTKCLSAFFRRQSNLRLTNARVKSDTWVLLSLLNCNCLDFEDFRGRIECVSFSIPYFGQLYYSRLKDAGRTDVYVHTSRLGEKILAAGSDFVSTHHGKEVVLVFNKDTREAFSIACNTQSDMLQLFWCRKCSKGNLKKKLKTLIRSILTGLYVTKQSAANHLSSHKAALLIFQLIAFHSTKSSKKSSLQRHKRDKKLPFPFLWA